MSSLNEKNSLQLLTNQNNGACWVLKCSKKAGFSYPFDHIVEHKYNPWFFTNARQGTPIVIEDMRAEQAESVVQFLCFVIQVCGVKPVVYYKTSRPERVSDILRNLVKKVIYVFD